ncbi:acyltransferase family protein [Aurantiacibacter sp. MUD61]|uniref:acyltransferase family protein n=1 Tax=Aurantiacibacter sp. MUD61 TaxID=3009083 RepID=UPI0022F056E9|nr:acyltransferase [Aurantiacibacter sp. MUD61]
MTTVIAPPERPPHLPALTGTRGIAAWFVVLYHARLSLTGWVPEPLIGVFARGYLAVDLFFMLSGFVMWLNYGPRLRAGGLAGAPDFWWRRVARIWPLHIAVLLAMVGFAVLLVVTGRPTDGYPFAELPLHVLLLQNWGFTDALSWNHPAWSISAEMGAYVVFPFLVLAVRWEEWRVPALIVMILACALALAGVFTAFGAATLGEEITRLGLLRCVLQFTIGMMLALLWLRWRNGAVKALWPALLGFALLASWALTQRAETLLVPLGFAASLIGLALSTGPAARLLGGRVFEWLGDISYATYLIHFPLFILAKIVLADDAAQIGPGGFAIYCVALLILSHLAYGLLEKPAQRALNRFAPSKRRSAVPAE